MSTSSSLQISICLDHNQRAKYGIGHYKILNDLALQGFTTVSGNLEMGNLNLPIHITDSYNNERDVAEQIVYSDPKGNIVRLKDIAQIKREYPKLNKYIKSNGNKCVLLSIEMRPGNDIVKMGRDVHKMMDDFEQSLPGDVHINTITDQSKVVSESVLNFLRELLSYSQRPDVGAVGAKLYYPDDTIQHAGVLMGINGSAGHSHKSYPRTAVGDMYRLVTTQNYMAVTGACLMTKASLYRAFGGLDEEKFAVAYNDVDYCLKLWQKGLLNVYTPRAEAYHYESKSRGLDTLSENAKRYEREKANFYAKYQQYIDNYDPYYNPHFNNLFENFGLK